MARQIFLIACGGCLGSVARYLIYLTMSSYSQSYRFPMGTLAVNVVGCLSIGSLFGYLRAGEQVNQSPIFWFVATGFLGAFTTFSAFSLDILMLVDAGRIAAAFLNIVLNVGICLSAVFAGRSLMLWLVN